MKTILPAIGVIQTDEPTQYFITPFQDGASIFTSFLQQAQSKIRSMIYGFTLQQAFDILIAKKEAGADAKAILDHTQAMGHAEKPQIERLVAAGWKDGVDFLIGTAPDHHAINHLKATWLDGQHVLTGSWNYSQSATQEYNDISIVTSPELAATMDKAFDFAWAWILANEQAYQTFTPPSPVV